MPTYSPLDQIRQPLPVQPTGQPIRVGQPGQPGDVGPYPTGTISGSTLSPVSTGGPGAGGYPTTPGVPAGPGAPGGGPGLMDSARSVPPPENGRGTPAPPPVPPPENGRGTPTPQTNGAPIDPQQAQTQLMAQFQAKFGRAMTPAEIARLQENIGYKPGMPITQDMMDRAAQLIGGYSGNLSDYAPTGTGPAAGKAPVTPQSLEQQQREQLMALLRGETPVGVDLNNPAVQAERAHFNRANSQATTRQRLANSERAAARGTLSTGGFDAGQAGIENEAATRSTGFEAELMRNERQGQIDRLMSALGMTQQYGATQLQGQLGRGQLALGYLNAMLGNQQAGNQLGLGYAQLQNLMNNQAIQALLQGL